MALCPASRNVKPKLRWKAVNRCRPLFFDSLTRPFPFTLSDLPVSQYVTTNRNLHGESSAQPRAEGDLEPLVLRCENLTTVRCPIGGLCCKTAYMKTRCGGGAPWRAMRKWCDGLNENKECPVPRKCTWTPPLHKIPRHESQQRPSTSSDKKRF